MMNLETKTLANLDLLINEPCNHDDSENYIGELLKQTNADKLFQGYQLCRNQTNKPIQMSITKENKFIIINYNLKNIQKWVLKNPVNFMSDEEYYRFLLSFSVLHEVAHAYQMLCGEKQISKFEEVNQLYANIYDAIDRNLGPITALKYKHYHDQLCHERNANMVAVKLLKDIYRGKRKKFLELVYVNSLLKNSYQRKNGRIISPAEKTYELLKIKKELLKLRATESETPFEVRLEHGLPIRETEYDIIFERLLEEEDVDCEYLTYVVKSLSKTLPSAFQSAINVR